MYKVKLLTWAYNAALSKRTSHPAGLGGPSDEKVASFHSLSLSRSIGVTASSHSSHLSQPEQGVCVNEVGGFLKPPPPYIKMAINNSSHALSP
jgi:hypothetical protein